MGTRYLQQIRKLLPEDVQDIDPYLLLLTRGRLNPKFQEYGQLKYGSIDYERLEFLGDAVLDLVIRTLLYDRYELATPGQLSQVKAALVNNRALACFSSELDFCHGETKECADILEALIGAVYLHLRPKPDLDSISWISEWLGKILSLDALIDKILYGVGNPSFYPCIPRYMTQQINLSNVAKSTMLSQSQRYQRLQELEAELGIAPLEENIIEDFTAKQRDEFKLPYEDQLERYTDEIKQLPSDILDEMNRIIARELSSRRQKTNRQLIKEFFERKRFGKIDYTKLKPMDGFRHHLGILCPLQICNDPKILLGEGVGHTLDEAREDTCANAINNLREKGYLDSES